MLGRRMPGGVLEERLRAWVKARLLRGVTPKGRTTRLAQALDQPVEWVSMYKAGDRDADFDRSVAVLSFFNLNVDDLVKNDLPSEADLLIWEAVRPLDEKKKRWLLAVTIYLTDQA